MSRFHGEDEKPEPGKAGSSNDSTANTPPPPRAKVKIPPPDLIDAEGHPPFTGRWVAQFFDRANHIRYSMGIAPGARIFVLALNDITRQNEWLWFATAADFKSSDRIPERLKRRPETFPLMNSLGKWPPELD